MTTSPRGKSSRDKVRAHRERLRRQGLRPIQLWVPDVRAPSFKAKAHRQSLAVAKKRPRQAERDHIQRLAVLIAHLLLARVSLLEAVKA